MIIDTHAHLDMKEFDSDRERIFKNRYRSNIQR